MSKRGEQQVSEQRASEQQVSEQSVGTAGVASSLRVAFVPGVTITKWSRIWRERQPNVPLEFIPCPETSQVDVLHDTTADISFVRLPIGTDGLSVIRLYDEIGVVVVSSDDPIAAVASDAHDSLTLADLDGYTLHDISMMDAADAVTLVAAGVGAVILPHSIARLHNRKDVISRTVTDVAPTTISLAWLTSSLTPQIEDFVGIVRGRSANSSRANPTPPTAQAAKRATQKAVSAEKKTAKNGTAASQKRVKDSAKKPRTAADDARAKRARVQNGRRKQGR